MKNLYKNIIRLIGAITICGQLSAQQTFINIEWDIGLSDPGQFELVSCDIDPNGNLVCAGTIINGTHADIFLSCTHPSGNVIFQQTCPSSPIEDDFGTDLKVDNAGNIYLCGAHHNGSNYDYFTAKYTQAGVLLWHMFYNGPGNDDDMPSALDIDGAGNVYVTGGSIGSGNDKVDYATIKYDNNGNQLWVKRYNFSNKIDAATDVVVDNSGNILVVGGSQNNWFNTDFAVRKYDPNGNVLATKRHNTPGNGYDVPVEMVVDDLDNVFVTGVADATGNTNVKVIAYNSNLQIQWVEYIDGSGSADEGRSISVDPAGDIVITGFSTKISGGTDFIVAKYNPANGNMLWQNSWTAPMDSDISKGHKITTDNAGNIYATGEIQNGTSLDFTIISFDPTGDVRFAKEIDIMGNDGARHIAFNDDVIYLTGISDSAGTRQTTTVKISVFEKDQPIV